MPWDRVHTYLHRDAAEGDGKDAGHLEYLGGEVGQVGHREHEQRLQHRGMVREPRIEYTTFLSMSMMSCH